MARNTGTTTAIKLDGQTRARLKALGQARRRFNHSKRETLDRWERYKTTGEHISGDAIKMWLERWGTENDDQSPAVGD